MQFFHHVFLDIMMILASSIWQSSPGSFQNNTIQISCSMISTRHGLEVYSLMMPHFVFVSIQICPILLVLHLIERMSIDLRPPQSSRNRKKSVGIRTTSIMQPVEARDGMLLYIAINKEKMEKR